MFAFTALLVLPMSRIKLANSPTIRRMPTYLHKLLRMRLEGKEVVSTTELADYMNIELIVVRKDIMLTGVSGRRRVGYDINDLINHIMSFLGWEQTIRATLIGAGALGAALLGYDDFSRYGLLIESVFDCDSSKIGQEIRGHEIYDIATIRTRLKLARPDIAIICVPNLSAQLVADQVISLGVHYIWNFANVCLQVPENVIVQREVIAGGLAMLSVKMKYDRNQLADARALEAES